MKSKTYNCPMCGKDAKFVRFVAELVPTPRSMNKEDLKRRPPFGELMRDCLIDCPEHGEVFNSSLGHHISTIPKKKSTKKTEK